MNYYKNFYNNSYLYKIEYLWNNYNYKNVR